MFTLVVGGAASGKSEYAEQLILRAGALPRYYVATMEPFGAEARARRTRCLAMRARKSGSRPLNAPLAFRGCCCLQGARRCWNA